MRNFSRREGEYIYRLVEQMIGVQGKQRKRVWIDSQTEEEIKRGIKEAKELSEYDSLADSAYLRAKEDYYLVSNPQLSIYIEKCESDTTIFILFCFLIARIFYLC